MQPAVRCRAVSKHFDAGSNRVEALRGVDLEVQPGEMTFLVGPSGCGKTTLISVVAGLLDASSGEVCLFGRNVAELNANARIDFRLKEIGFVFQQYNLLPSLTAAENAAVPLIAAGVPRREAVRRAEEMLHRLQLQDRLDALPGTLSGGQQQRVALARALVHAPRLVLCDEPTAALDHATGESVMESLISVAVRPECAVLVVTHDSRLFHLADRVAHMDDGRIARVECGRKSPVAGVSS